MRMTGLHYIREKGKNVGFAMKALRKLMLKNNGNLKHMGKIKTGCSHIGNIF